MFRRERSSIGNVTDVKIRNDAEHTLLLLLLDLHIRKFIWRKFDVHFGHLGGNGQHDQWGDVGLPGTQNPGEVLRGETRRRNRKLEGAWSNIEKGELSIVV